MANSISSRKRIRQNTEHRIRNRARKSMVKTETGKFLDLIQKGEFQQAQEALAGVQKKLDQIGAKGTLHRNTVARRKSRLTRHLNAAMASAGSE